MGIKSLFGFGQARDKPVDKAADAGYSFLFGRTTSGKPVNETTAMQTTAVYACVRILSEAIASLPVHVYQYKDGGGKEMVIDHPLYQVLHDEPNPEMTSFVFRETLMSHLLIWGNAYAQIIRDGAGRVLGLYPLLPNKIDVQRDDKCEIYYVYSRSSDENPNFKEYGDIKLKKEDVLHICSTYIQEGKEACKGIRVRDELLTGLSFTESMVVEEVIENGEKHYDYTSKRAYDNGERAADRNKEKGRSVLPRVNRSRRTVIEL